MTAMFDLRNVTQDRLGAEGVDWPSELSALLPRLIAGRDALLGRKDDPGQALGWIDLPTRQDLWLSTKELAARYSGYQDLVVLGIGGSSLGGLTLTSALQHPQRSLQTAGIGLRVHFVDNVDGDVISGLLETLDPAGTVINVISKSGATTETMAAYMIFKQWLQNALGKDYAEHIVATTDPEKGVLRPMSTKYGFATLPVPANVGGRFSVLSPVGTFPAALAGLDVPALLRGAEKANATFLGDPEKSDAALFAAVNCVFAGRGKSMTVFMPYSTRLRFLSDWFAQLWAESLGKRVNAAGQVVHSGTTPVKAVGATDQHSQVQLYTEGPNDKLFTFVRVQQPGAVTLIPNVEPDEPDMNYLAGRSFHDLLNAEQAATANALRQNGRPNLTYVMPSVSAEALGELLQTLMLATALEGELLGINAFDQPGVELGKVYTYALMGRPGFEQQARELRDAGVEA